MGTSTKNIIFLDIHGNEQLEGPTYVSQLSVILKKENLQVLVMACGGMEVSFWLRSTDTGLVIVVWGSWLALLRRWDLRRSLNRLEEEAREQKREGD